MAWKGRTELEERKVFIEDWQLAEGSFAELCRKYGISRQTGYKWVDRFEVQGLTGLEELSRAPHASPQIMSQEVRTRIVALREQHPRWGPRKLRAWLSHHDGDVLWPATSSVGALLRREGLTQGRRKRHRTVRYSEPLAHAIGANQVWCTDFKGWFLCGDGKRCDPLTMSDAFSRYLLRCRSVEKTDGPHVRAIFESAFREWGMPESIRTDNGSPFATQAPGGLSRLNIWWMRLGIRHERIEPGCPQQNGRHERMHSTLKQETAAPPAGNLRQQQEAFVRFQEEYNHQRPHEALGYQTPASVYVASSREYPARLPELEYPRGAILRKVNEDGRLRWTNRRAFVSKVLGGEYVGLQPVDDGFYEVYFGGLLLGWYDEAENYFAVDPGPQRRRRKRQGEVSQG
jgi:transposase InsO family protein